jgi:hypothetical protein
VAGRLKKLAGRDKPPEMIGYSVHLLREERETIGAELPCFSLRSRSFLSARQRLRFTPRRLPLLARKGWE